jgi:murein tripeptide amidase MpaA
VLYESTQHAREWIATEVERLFQYIVDRKDQKGGAQIKKLLAKTELWFIPVVNPDGYGYTFVNTTLVRDAMRYFNVVH